MRLGKSSRGQESNYDIILVTAKCSGEENNRIWWTLRSDRKLYLLLETAVALQTDVHTFYNIMLFGLNRAVKI